MVFVFGGRGLATLLLFPCVMEEVGRKCVWVMPWPLCGRMQYDYKQTNRNDRIPNEQFGAYPVYVDFKRIYTDYRMTGYIPPASTAGWRADRDMFYRTPA